MSEQGRIISRSVLWVALMVIGANLPVVGRYASGWGALAYTIGLTVLAVLRLWDWPREPFWKWVTLAMCLLSLAMQLFLLNYIAPAYDGQMDRDDALVLWWQRFIRGADPYAYPTSMGNPISILPFLHLVAFPFVLLGNVGYLVIVSTIVFAILLCRRYAHNPVEQELALLFLATAPVILFEVAGRSDIVVNMLIFTVLVLWVEGCIQGNHVERLPWLGLFTGAVAATRFAIWPAMVVPVVYLLGHLPLRQAAFVLVAALFSFAVLVVPFIIWQPSVFFGYAPFGVNATKLGNHLVWRIFWMALTALVVLAASWYAWKTGHLFLASVPVFACITLATWTTFGYDVAYGQFLFVPLLFSFPRKVSL